MDISARAFFVPSSDPLQDGGDQVVSLIEIGSCSLQEKQMLVRSVKALIRRRD